VIFRDWRYRNNTIAGMLAAQVSMNWPWTAAPRGDGGIVPETFDEMRQE
jgi:hypothetical protein